MREEGADDARRSLVAFEPRGEKETVTEVAAWAREKWVRRDPVVITVGGVTPDLKLRGQRERRTAKSEQ